MRNIKKIITHAGVFHADEILAIALIRRVFGELPIERTYRPTEEDFEDPSTIVLDVGRRADPIRNNYDHHQDGEIPATNILILDQLVDSGRLKDLLKEYLFSYVDRVDRGIVVERPEDGVAVPTFNAIIRSLNNTESKSGFSKACTIATMTLDAVWATAEQAVAGEKKWATLEKRDGFAIQMDSTVIPGWRELAEAEGILALVSPNIRVEGAFQVTSRDTDIFKVPQDDRQTFLHANQFIAAYESFEDAVAHAEEALRPLLGNR